MAYNKAKEEKKWLINKEAEEKNLRRLGVSEDTIKELRKFDWEIFNSDRRYYQRVLEDDRLLSTLTSYDISEETENIDVFLNSIENQNLYKILLNTDKITLKMILMKLNGYTVLEISKKLGVKEGTVYKRLSRLKMKIKKTLNN